MATFQSARDIKKWCKKAGLETEKCGSGHFKINIPSGRAVICPSSPSDGRALKNLRSQLRRNLREADWEGELP